MKKGKRAFTLVELLAVIAILAIILLIAVPMILGVIEDAKQESFRNSVRGVFHAVELFNARTGKVTGTIAELDMSGESLTGTWMVTDGKVTLIKISNGKYCVSSLSDENKGSKFSFDKDCNIAPPSGESFYRDAVLNGTDPVIKGDLIPVTIANDGTVKKANTAKEWYDYDNKEWANAVILVDKSVTYEALETIPEDNIESYFVWIPRYKYKIFDEGTYTGATELQEGKIQSIEVVFEDKNTIPSTGSTKDSWLTHPAFINFDVNGLWVGKFELGYKGATTSTEAEKSEIDSTKVIVKPNVYSWRKNTIKNFFEILYNYNRSLDSHMIKNTEWGAVAYLTHSKYGIGENVGINNYYNAEISDRYKTGCGDTAGSAVNAICNDYTSEKGVLASTTGNITGIYDMNGGANEYVAGYRANTYIANAFDKVSIDNYLGKYFDIYNENSNETSYQYRILGDATGELGPFVDGRGSWYMGFSNFINSASPWFGRGGSYSNGRYAGLFSFTKVIGTAGVAASSRLVLAV